MSQSDLNRKWKPHLFFLFIKKTRMEFVKKFLKTRRGSLVGSWPSPMYSTTRVIYVIWDPPLYVAVTFEPVKEFWKLLRFRMSCIRYIVYCKLFANDPLKLILQFVFSNKYSLLFELIWNTVEKTNIKSEVYVMKIIFALKETHWQYSAVFSPAGESWTPHSI